MFHFSEQRVTSNPNSPFRPNPYKRAFECSYEDPHRGGYTPTEWHANSTNAWDYSVPSKGYGEGGEGEEWYDAPTLPSEVIREGLLKGEEDHQ